LYYNLLFPRQERFLPGILYISMIFEISVNRFPQITAQIVTNQTIFLVFSELLAKKLRLFLDAFSIDFIREFAIILVRCHTIGNRTIGQQPIWRGID